MKELRVLLLFLFLKIRNGDQNLETVVSGRFSRLFFSPFDALPAIFFLAIKNHTKKEIAVTHFINDIKP